MSAPLAPEQVSQIKALLAEHGLTVSRKRGTKAKAKPKRYKRLCGYQGPTRAALSRGVVSTAAIVSGCDGPLGVHCFRDAVPPAGRWRGTVPVNGDAGDGYRAAHAAANAWLRENAERLGVTFGPRWQ